jgi:hypothetical protein
MTIEVLRLKPSLLRQLNSKNPNPNIEPPEEAAMVEDTIHVRLRKRRTETTGNAGTSCVRIFNFCTKTESEANHQEIVKKTQTKLSEGSRSYFRPQTKCPQREP